MADENVFPKSDGDVWYASDANAVPFGNFEAGENITADEAVYVSDADGKVYVSTTGNTADYRVSGIAINTALSGATVYVQMSGNWATTGLVANDTYYLGAAGAISTTASNVQVGVATSTTNLFIQIKELDQPYTLNWYDGTTRTTTSTGWNTIHTFTSQNIRLTTDWLYAVSINFEVSHDGDHSEDQWRLQVQQDAGTWHTVYQQTGFANMIDRRIHLDRQDFQDAWQDTDIITSCNVRVQAGAGSGSSEGYTSIKVNLHFASGAGSD